ncbi:MAG: hypothetical protein ACREIA_25350 [Opitutaceae bacterium]
MGLFIAQRIRKREFGKAIPPVDKAALLEGARICLAEVIAGQGLPKGTRLLKACATTKQGPRRILYLLVVAEGDLFVLFYRDKQDKVGANMSPKSEAFNAALARHLDLLRDDIAADRIEEIAPDQASPV